MSWRRKSSPNAVRTAFKVNPLTENATKGQNHCCNPYCELRKNEWFEWMATRSKVTFGGDLLRWIGTHRDHQYHQPLLDCFHVDDNEVGKRLAKLIYKNRTKNFVFLFENSFLHKVVSDLAKQLLKSGIWSHAENHRDLLARAPKVLRGQQEYENAPSGGVWVRKTSEGKII